MAEVRWERNALGVVLDMQERTRQRVLSQVSHLRRFPELGVPALGPFVGKRRLVIGPYSVVYEYDSKGGVVSAIAVARGGPLFH
ncbi:MAG: type II toxin-antitoxin system RelE/ParE family toxin [Candidatus Dormibacteraeota bacterium]|nr:type II toxin-antitoxin system RelE/ParE family toxin [Candidatus Dormibacteraeota bacterium]